MATIEQIAQSSFQNGRKLNESEFRTAHREGKNFGGSKYHFNCYIREYNKLQRAADGIKFETNDLIQTLKVQTESLRVQYLEKVESWAKKDFSRFEKAASVPYPVYADFATPGFVKGSGYASIDYEQGKKYQKALDIRHAANKIVEAGIDAYINRELKLAELHYQSSILKLAARIEKKELDQSNLKIETSHIGVNINTTFTDGIQIVRAWTIIAEGPVQKPHYRYLVK